MRSNLLLLVIIWAPSSLNAQALPVQCAYRSLLQTEYAFVREASASGIRAAFLHYLDERSVVFRPDPRPGRTVYTEWKETGASLSWRPQLAGVSLEGDIGYTTGPWEYRNGPARPVIARGQFVSVWKKDASDTWRLVVDFGASCKTRNSTDSLAIPGACDSTVRHLPVRGDKRGVEQEVLSLDSSLWHSNSSGTTPVFDSLAVLVREGSSPAVGVQAAQKWTGRLAGGICRPQFVDVSQSGDLAYTYGEMKYPKKRM